RCARSSRRRRPASGVESPVGRVPVGAGGPVHYAVPSLCRRAIQQVGAFALSWRVHVVMARGDVIFTPAGGRMAEVKEVRVPDIGGFDNVPVIEVLIKPGDSISKDQGLVTLESDKATMEVPAPFAGTVKEVKVSE